MTDERVQGPGIGALVSRIPWPLRVGLLVVLVQALVFLGLGIAEIVSLSTTRLVMGLSTAAFFLGYGVVLAACVRGMALRSSTGRSVVMMGQLIHLGLAYSYRNVLPTLAAVLAVSAVVAIVGIMHPASIAALDDEE